MHSLASSWQIYIFLKYIIKLKKKKSKVKFVNGDDIALQTTCTALMTSFLTIKKCYQFREIVILWRTWQAGVFLLVFNLPGGISTSVGQLGECISAALLRGTPIGVVGCQSFRGLPQSLPSYLWPADIFLFSWLVVGRTSIWRTWCHTDRVWVHGFPQSASSADSLTVSVQPLCSTACINIGARVKNRIHSQLYRCLDIHTPTGMGSAALAAVRWLKFLHTPTGMGSAALAAVRWLKFLHTDGNG